MTALDIKAIRASTPISVVVAQHVKLTRAGREWKACCPFHADKTPSFTVNDDKGFYHCFGCGAHGDLLDFIQAIEQVGLRQAAARVSRLPVSYRPPPAADDRDRSAEALAIWRQASSIKGTPAETYLRSRGLICALPKASGSPGSRMASKGRSIPA